MFGDFFKSHFLGIFLSSVAAGIVATYIYDHWSNKALLALFHPRESIQPSSRLITEPKKLAHSGSAVRQDSRHSSTEPFAFQLRTAPMDLSKIEASGNFVRYLPRLPLRDKAETLSTEGLIADLQSAGFKGLKGESQWPQWVASADVENNYIALDDSNIRIVSDRKTGLDWYVSSTVDRYSWDQANVVVRRLNAARPLGLSGWHLPTTLELASILEPEKRSQIYNKRTGEIYSRYCIDPLLLPNTVPRLNYSAQYWSSDLKSERWAWTLDFGTGCGFHKWGRDYDAEILAVRNHED